MAWEMHGNQPLKCHRDEGLGETTRQATHTNTDACWRDLEWMEEEGNTCGHEINCKSLDQGPQFTPLYPLLSYP